jgi:cation:H+ antiporter
MHIDQTTLLIFAIATVILGMAILIKSGDWLVDGAVQIARAFGVPSLLVGFTVVAFGTSLPELVVSVNANLKGAPAIAIGNVIGSNIANILLVIGAGAVFGTLVAKRKELMLDMGKMLLATALFIALIFHGYISSFAGFLMILALVAYVVMQYGLARRRQQSDPQAQSDAMDIEEPAFSSTPIAGLFTIIGALGIALGAELMVRGAITTAQIMRVPEDVIGLTIIAIGTSLPELSTAIIAALKKQGDIVIGNVVGSNVFNIMMILGVMSMVKPVSMAQIAPQVMSFDVWVMLATALIFCLAVLFYARFTRVGGIIFLSGYCAYMGAIYMLYT